MDIKKILIDTTFFIGITLCYFLWKKRILLFFIHLNAFSFSLKIFGSDTLGQESFNPLWLSYFFIFISALGLITLVIGLSNYKIKYFSDTVEVSKNRIIISLSIIFFVMQLSLRLIY